MSEKIKVIGADWCPFCSKVKKYLSKQNIQFTWVDTDTT